MREVKNKYYVALYILMFLVASIFVVTGVALAIVALVNTKLMLDVYNKVLVEIGRNISYSNLTYSNFKITVMSTGISFIVYSGFLYVLGAIYAKDALMNNYEAYKRYRKLAICNVILFLFAGPILPFIALAGLIKVQTKQYYEYLYIDQDAYRDLNENDKYSVKHLNNMIEPLTRVQSLISSGAISEEEGKYMREQILIMQEDDKLGKKQKQVKTPKEKPIKEKREAKKETVTEKNVRVDKKTVIVKETKIDEQTKEKLLKLEQLKNQGSISIEQYESLKAKIVGSNKF